MTFSEGLGGLLKSMHKGDAACWQVPESLRTKRDITEQLTALQKKLNKAIETESFEQAAQLRDEIKQLNNRLAEATA